MKKIICWIFGHKTGRIEDYDFKYTPNKKSYFLMKDDVIWAILQIKWYERFIFWERGKEWVKKRAFERWIKRVSMPYA